jgi:hypothetical protein
MFSIIDDMDKRERDYSIDFVKGVAILFVILLHNMPNESIYSIAYIGQAVPLFLLVSSYLTYGGFQRKGFNGYFSARNVKKMLDRVFLPFFLLIFSQCAIFYLLKGGVDWQRLYMQGGFGPGSYYLGEWFTCVFHVPDNVYRLLFYRYLFLLYLGCVILKFKIKLNVWVCRLALIALFLAILEIYTSVDLMPYLTNQWKGYHWVDYFYTLFVFFLLVKLYNYIMKSRLSVFFVKLGNYSYEVFFFQMLVFSLISEKRFFFIENEVFRNIVYVLTTIVFSIVPVLVYKEYIKKLYVR